MRKLTNKKGFTLIELVIVVAVLAILAVIAVPAVGGITASAKDSKDKANLALYQSAIERYNVDKGVYPGISADTDADVKTAVVNTIATYTNRKSVDEPGKGKIYYVKVGTVQTDGVNYTAGQVFKTEKEVTSLTVNSVAGVAVELAAAK